MMIAKTVMVVRFLKAKIAETILSITVMKGVTPLLLIVIGAHELIHANFTMIIRLAMKIAKTTPMTR